MVVSREVHAVLCRVGEVGAALEGYWNRGFFYFVERFFWILWRDGSIGKICILTRDDYETGINSW